MGKISTLLWGTAIGAGMMYFLDPEQGNRRKAQLRDQVYQLRSRGDEALETAVNDLRNRTRGVLAEGMSILSNEELPDNILQERVRSRMGMLTRHPGAVRASVQNGTLTLEGDILQDEVETLTHKLGKVRGLRGVENRLTTHKNADDLPQLMNESATPGQFAGQWSPSTRLIATTGAGYLLFYSLMRGGFIGFVARIGGLFLGIRALSNMNPQQLTGKGIEQGMIRVNKSIQINSPVEEVYELWSNFDNFSRFMNNIDSVRMMGDRSHWVVKGPAGSKVEFDAITTAMVPNEMVSWETTPDSMVKHQGQVRFRESGNGTQVNVNMSYTPPAGAVGHAVASLFGKDPKTEMDADLARMKSLLEQGRTRAGGQHVTREEVTGSGSSGAEKSSNKQGGETRGQKEKAANTTAVPVTGSQDDEGSQSSMSGKDISEKIRRDMGGGEENTPGGEQDRH